jgi:hypothetical protein
LESKKKKIIIIPEDSNEESDGDFENENVEFDESKD